MFLTKLLGVSQVGLNSASDGKIRGLPIPSFLLQLSPFEQTSFVIMDILVAQTLRQMYTFFYQQVAAPLNITTVIPAPDTLTSMIGTAASSMYQYVPETVLMYYDKVMSLPVQSNVVPVLLALVVLYVVYSLIMMTLRGIFRLIYNFVRFSLILFTISSLLYIAQQYVYNGTPLLQTILDIMVTPSNGQGGAVMVPNPPAVVSPL